MSFDDILADANDAFMDAFAEEVLIVYRPAGGDPRNIMAIIDRSPPTPIEPGKKGVTYSLMISVRNDPQAGIDITAFDSGADTVDVPIEIGGGLVTRTFADDKIEQDGGMVMLKVR